MFLTVKDYTIPDFLTALGFIAPKGMSVDYILAPDTIKPEAQNQIEAEGYVEQPALDLTNVKYLKKDLKQTHSFSPKANQIEDPNLLPPEMPKAAPVPMDPNLGNNNQVMTPKRGIIIAECINTDYEKSLILRESFCGIPRNTMVVFHESENGGWDIRDEDADEFSKKVIDCATSYVSVFPELRKRGFTVITSVYSNTVEFTKPGDNRYSPSGDYITIRHGTKDYLEKYPEESAWKVSYKIDGKKGDIESLKDFWGEEITLNKASDVMDSILRTIENPQEKKEPKKTKLIGVRITPSKAALEEAYENHSDEYDSPEDGLEIEVFADLKASGQIPKDWEFEYEDSNGIFVYDVTEKDVQEWMSEEGISYLIDEVEEEWD